MLYTQEDVKNLGTILGVWAHPDDECWSSAGLMRLATLNGQKVGIITATKGDAGETADENKWPKVNLGQIREKELEDCLCFIGDIEQFWLDYKDGLLKESDEKEAVEKINRIINLFNPDTVITFEPNGITGHEDHMTISKWTSLAIMKSPKKIRLLQSYQSEQKYGEAGKYLDEKFNIFFSIDRPNLISESDADVLIKLDDDLLECKVNCLKAHASQTRQIFSDDNDKNTLRLFVDTECFKLF